MDHILIAGPIHERGMALLDRRPDITYELLDAPSEGDLLAKLPSADALMIRTAVVTPEALARAGRLRVVSRHGVGYDNLPLEALTARGIPLALVGDVNSVTVAEHTLFLMMALAKRCIPYDRAVRDGDWDLRNSFGTRELSGKTLLILGFGRIGRRLARRALAFDMRVLAHDPYVEDAALRAAGVGGVDDWRAELPAVDFVSLHLPLTPETRYAIGTAELAAMKPGAFLINAARGGLVDEAALAVALSAGEIAGAGLDTFESEPPPPDHPLLTQDKVVLTPHCASLTEECAARMAIATAANALAGLDGTLDPELVVNRQVLSRG